MPFGTEQAAVHHLANNQCVQSSRILLATASMQIHASNGHSIKVRALLDQSSTWTFISEPLVRALKLETTRVYTSITGIGCSVAGSVHRAAEIVISPTHSNQPVFQTHALVLKSLTSYTPSLRSCQTDWPHLKHITFADENPFDSARIDLLIGSDLYGSILLDGVIKGDKDQPVAQNSAFGWFLSGWTSSPAPVPSSSTLAHLCHDDSRLCNSMQRFWEIEEVSRPKPISHDDIQCEQHFRETHWRNSDGRYVVRLPFRVEPTSPIGIPREFAIRSFCSLERRLVGAPADALAYREFMHDYEEQGHMVKMKATDSSAPFSYLPHHCVKKESSTTTKVRVVFNASSKTSDHCSLNDLLLTGTKLQSDLPLILTQWRVHRYVYCADIAQMYRQILIDPRDRNFQRIIWRYSPKEPLTDYQLSTVTFGVSCAPFLALRVLQQLAIDAGTQFPLGAEILRNEIYVDDCLIGAQSHHEAKRKRDELIQLLQLGGFVLRKWGSNDKSLLSGIDDKNHGLAWNQSITDEKSVKILGIHWNPDLDSFHFEVNWVSPSVITKRSLLSVISQFFDPLGWASPVTILAKMLIQQLWLIKLDWDSTLPSDLQNRWRSFELQAESLRLIHIPRWTHHDDATLCQLHGFADASNSAYAASVFLRVVTKTNDVKVTLLVGKAKVAPLKTLSVPRLELCASVLLARLLNSLQVNKLLGSLPVTCWTDSTIVLAWLKQHPARWQTFVANRVSEIHERLPEAHWRHVPTHDNPADLASRGLASQPLHNCKIWFNGPVWLARAESYWPISTPTLPKDAPLEIRSKTVCHVSLENDTVNSLATRISSWDKILRIISLCLRWKARIVRPSMDNPASQNQTAEFVCYRWLQSLLFEQELRDIRAHATVSRKSPLYSLTPFIDEHDLIRVGGRLKHADLPLSSIHPVVIGNHPVVRLLVYHAYLRCLHGGIKLTLATLRQKIWLLQARKHIQSVIFHCVTCSRSRADTATQIMSNLPPPRVLRPDRPFSHCGVDYAGPIRVRVSRGRGRIAHPAYICLFVCFAIKAIHLELVSDYSSLAFIAAFKRFVSRRGIPVAMYSDCGTTFVGAKTELRKAYQQSTSDPEFQTLLVKDAIQWHFLPPSAPHFGGLWEAGVKSVKYHLKRIIGNHTPTFEECSTLLCEIEAVLNSRPLSPLTADIEDLTVITPAHFLIGGPLTAIPGRSLLECSANRLTRWQLYRQMFERFWRIWSSDYLRSLQHRTKWRERKTPIAVGQIVLVRTANMPPAKWPLARVLQCFPGDDGFVRVVRVRTATGELTRPITKLALLPVHLEGRDAEPSDEDRDG